MPERDSLSPKVEEKIRLLIEYGHTVSAIKQRREVTGWRLAEAKMWVDRVLIGHGFTEGCGFKPCPFCGEPLRTHQAEQCFECGADWHNTDLSFDYS